MTTYTPDYWVVVKITPKDTTIEPHFRVFATWDGGYTTGARWKMNSGITEAKKDGEWFEFYGSSGSVYKCHENCYRVNGYGMGVLSGMIEDAAETMTIEILDKETTDFLTLPYC